MDFSIQQRAGDLNPPSLARILHFSFPKIKELIYFKGISKGIFSTSALFLKYIKMN